MPTDHARAAALQAAIFNSANFAYIATDARGVVQVFNVGAERMLGYAAVEVTNRVTPADLSDPAELITRADALSEELQTPIAPGFEALVFKASRGIEDIYELTYVRKDGSRFAAVVSVTALRDADESIIGFLLICTDNTARKQIEDERTRLDQRLADQQLYTRSLIESNVDAIMTTDPRGFITDVNKQAEALTGSTREQLIGAPFRDYFTDPIGADAGIAQVLGLGTVNDYELTARSSSGALTPVSINGTTFNDRDDHLQGVFVAARDVTDRRRFEATLHQKNAELEDASRMKSEFLANMSHELRTPLNAIIGFSEVLRDGLVGELTEQQRGFIGDIFGSGSHLLALINDILDLSKVEAGKMSLDLEPVAASLLFVNSLSIIREKAAARNIRLHLEATEELGSIRVDATKVKQIVYNLLSNALKFTPEGGRVTLGTARVSQREVGRRCTPWPQRALPRPTEAFAQFLEISVTDTGIGIAEGALERLFWPFSQIDSGLSRKFEGTGLGLAMVKLLAELHGGTAAVESAVDQGSRFTVWLPLRSADPAEDAADDPAQDTLKDALNDAADDATDGRPNDAQDAVGALGAGSTRAAGSARSTARPTARPAGRSALVLENDPKSADLIRLLLEAEGFTTQHATSAELALRLAAAHPPSLITVDIMLPHMDGWEFIERINRMPGLSKVPVVIVSIRADRRRGVALGAAAMLQKPLARRQLYDALAEAGLVHLGASAGLTVLVVDDDPKAVAMIAMRLQGFATRVLRAYGGQEAIDIAARERPDIILLDLMMPEVNGFDVVMALRERPGTAGTPIIIITAKSITAADRARLNGDVEAIMEKTHFGTEELRSEVRRALTHRREAH